MIQTIAAILISAIFLAYAIGGLYIEIKEDREIREAL